MNPCETMVCRRDPEQRIGFVLLWPVQLNKFRDQTRNRSCAWCDMLPYFHFVISPLSRNDDFLTPFAVPYYFHRAGQAIVKASMKPPYEIGMMGVLAFLNTLTSRFLRSDVCCPQEN